MTMNLDIRLAAKNQRRIIRNVFCATGEGGGIDPSCSPSSVLADKTFYHGTGTDFDKFDIGKLHTGADKGSGSWYGHGIYLSGEPWKGQAYAHSYGDTGKVLTVRTTAKNPYVIGPQHPQNRLHKDLEGQALTDELKRQGYDSIVSLKSDNSGKINELIVFDDKDVHIVEKHAVKGFDRDKHKFATFNARKSTKKTTIPNPLKMDPTKTATLRRLFTSDLRRRFKLLRAKILKLVVDEDAFGLKERKILGNVFCKTGAGGGIDPSCPLNSGGSSGADSKMKLKWFKEPGLKTKLEFVSIDSISGQHDIGYSKEASDKHAAGLAVAIQKSGRVQALTAQRLNDGRYKIIDGKHRLQALRQLGVTRIALQVSLTNNAFFISRVTTTNAVVAGRWQFDTNPQKVDEFRKWLESQVQAGLLQPVDAKNPKAKQLYWQRYIEDGYRKGMGRSYDDFTAKSAGKVSVDTLSDFYKGSRDEFMRTSFGQPETVEKVQLLTARTFTDLKGVGDQMATVMSRTLADGLVSGSNPREIADNLTDVLDISYKRAEVIARTEIIRAHAEGQLDAMEDMGVEEVGVMVEWSTAGDERVCPLCAELEGTVLRIEEAHNLIPRHPNCRCSFIPANVGEDTTDQVRSKDEIDAAIAASTKRESAEEDDESALLKSKWAGADLDVADKRPISILNFDPNQSRDEAGRFGSGSSSQFKIETVSPDDLQPTEFEQTEERLDAVRQAIPVGGPYPPVITVEKNGEKEILDGHHRWVVASERNDSLPVITITDKEFRALRRSYGDQEISYAALKLAGEKEQLAFLKDKFSQKGAIARGDAAAEELNKLRQQTQNTFCPTGPGGGVDPTCSPTESSSGQTASNKLEVVPMKKWNNTPSPGNGAEHLDYTTHEEMTDSPLLKFIGPSKYDYALVGRELRDQGKISELRQIHPDEPHSARDYNYAKGYANTSGGGFVDESPPNPSGINPKSTKYWSTAGTKKAENAGGNPQCSVIRKAADAKFGVKGQTDDKAGIVDALSPAKADALAKNLITAINKAEPAQPTLWRGIHGEQGSQVKNSGVGDTIEFTLGSTSRDGQAALVYSGTSENAVMIRILPGSKGIANREYFPHDQEVITGGKFKIVGKSVSQKHGITVIDVEQTETFKWQ